MSWWWPGSRLVRVVDGDTLDAQVTRDLGFGGSASFTVRLRLNRINCPPAYTDVGKAATAFATNCLTARTFDLETLKPYKYGGPDTSPGEWMAEVTLPTGNLSDLIVTAGLAVYWSGEGPRPGG